MKIRITQPGFESLTGPYGVVEFIEGVSVADVSGIEIDRLAASISIVNAETDEPIGVTARMVECYSDTAQVIAPLPRMSDLESEPAPVKDEPADTSLPKFWTSDELGDLADAGGIKAVREIAVRWDVRGKAIAELISEIIEAQNKFKKSRGIADEAVEPAAAPAK